MTGDQPCGPGREPACRCSIYLLIDEPMFMFMSCVHKVCVLVEKLRYAETSVINNKVLGAVTLSQVRTGVLIRPLAHLVPPSFTL